MLDTLGSDDMSEFCLKPTQSGPLTSKSLYGIIQSLCIFAASISLYSPFLTVWSKTHWLLLNSNVTDTFLKWFFCLFVSLLLTPLSGPAVLWVGFLCKLTWTDMPEADKNIISFTCGLQPNWGLREKVRESQKSLQFSLRWGWRWMWMSMETLHYLQIFHSFTDIPI